jgi:hypothetical protein
LEPRTHAIAAATGGGISGIFWDIFFFFCFPFRGQTKKNGGDETKREILRVRGKKSD